MWCVQPSYFAVYGSRKKTFSSRSMDLKKIPIDSDWLLVDGDKMLAAIDTRTNNSVSYAAF